MGECPSKSQAKRAGDLLKRFSRGDLGRLEELPGSQVDRLLAAYATVQGWRDSHAVPLNSVRMSLISFVRTTGVQALTPVQRHKRVPRIIRKLARPGATGKLDTMQDIGGCRVVLATLADLRRLEEHMRRTWHENIHGDPDAYDYIDRPQSSGYRAKHIVVQRQDRLIEVQLRTEQQHEWADWVEGLGRRIGAEIKSGEGPPELTYFARLTADLMASEEEGEPPPTGLYDEWSRARSDVDVYFKAY